MAEDVQCSSITHDVEALRYEVLAASPPGRRSQRRTWLLRSIGLVLLVGALTATWATLGRREKLHQLLTWIHEHRTRGSLAFSALYIWFTLLLLPSGLLAACAGAIYGLVPALPLVWVCSVVGETSAFLLGRFLLKSWVADLTADWTLWMALNAALCEDGWKLVALLRLSPATPFSLLNYALGSSSLPFSHFFWPSVFGILPGLLVYVWLGSLAADVGEAFAGGGAAAAPRGARIALVIVAALSALGVIIATTVYTRRAISRRLAALQLHESLEVQETRTLLLPGSDDSSSGGRRILVSVEAPRVVVGAARSPAGAADVDGT